MGIERFFLLLIVTPFSMAVPESGRERSKVDMSLPVARFAEASSLDRTHLTSQPPGCRWRQNI